MEKYKTKTNKAEEQIRELLEADMTFHRPWGLVDKKLTSRTLDCAASEVSIIFENNNSVRPGFEIRDDIVFSPNLFVKFSGFDDYTSYFYRLRDTKTKALKYANFNGFCDGDEEKTDLSAFFRDDGSLDKELLLKDESFQFTYLRREYQKLYLDKVEYIIESSNEYFLPGYDEKDRSVLLSYLLCIDVNLINEINAFDFFLKPPALVFYNDKRIKLTKRQAASLLLMNLLGSDIIILSGQGYSDIENCFNVDVYSLFYGEKIKIKKNLGKLKKVLIVSAAAIVLASSLALGSAVLKPRESVEPPVIADDISEVAEEVTDPAVEQNVNTIRPNGVIITSKSYENANYIDSQIDILIYGPDNERIDMSDVSYTIYRGERILSYNNETGKGPSRRSGPAFEVYTGVDLLQIVSKDDGGNINYIISGDNGDYAFLIEGWVPKNDYITDKRIEIRYNLAGLESTFLSVDTATEVIDEVDFYIFSSQEHEIDSGGFETGCSGTISTNQGKYLYTNQPVINLFTYYATEDGMVFYHSRNINTVEPSINVRMDKRQSQHRSFKINPEINQFPLYVIDIMFPNKYMRIDGHIPDDKTVSIYTNAFLPVTRISLSIDAYDLYESSVSGIRFNEDKVFGYNNKISRFFINSSENNWYSIEARFEDENRNEFAYLGYSNDGATPTEYDFIFDVVRGGQVVQSYTLNPYSDIIELDLSDGSYGVIAYPAYNNSLYDRVSYFRMIMDSKSEEKVGLEFIKDSDEYDISTFDNISEESYTGENIQVSSEHIGAQIDYVLSEEEKAIRDQIEAERIELVIIILNKYGYYTDELLEEYLRTGDATPVGRDIPPGDDS